MCAEKNFGDNLVKLQYIIIECKKKDEISTEKKEEKRQIVISVLMHFICI